MKKLAVGRVIRTTIYPFKGMQGITMPEITLRSVSVVGDRSRKLDLVNATETPTFVDTIKFPGLLKYAPYLVDPLNPKTSELRVKTPEGNDYSADGPELVKEISEKMGRNVTVVRMGRGAYHSMPVSVMTLGSIKAISDLVGSEVDARRFRMNVLIETDKNEVYEEETWVSKILTFGERNDSARIAVVKLDDRCATINMDPETGESNPEILKKLVQGHSKNLGVYCSIVREGRVLTGDPVFLSELS